MIQRKQTIFLGIAAIVSAICPFIFNLVVLNPAFYAFIASTVLSIIVIMLFKNRKLQIKLNFANAVLNFFLVGLLIYNLLKLPGDFEKTEMGIGLLIPIVVLPLLLLANQAINKDEQLVKSMDRIR